jgi:hypothetical protein
MVFDIDVFCLRLMHDISKGITMCVHFLWSMNKQISIMFHIDIEKSV